MYTHLVRATPLSAVGLRAAATVIEAPSSRLRWALAAVVLATVLMGCDGGRERVYDDTTLTLHAYIAPRPGEVLLEWTGGPSGAIRWEYSIRALPAGPPEWRDVPPGRVSPTGRRLRLKLEPGWSYEFRIRELGDPREPAEQAIARIGTTYMKDGRLIGFAHEPLEPGARFEDAYYGLTVRAPETGQLYYRPETMCIGMIGVELKVQGVTAWADLWVVPVGEHMEEWAEVWGAELLSGRARELRSFSGLTAREQAELAETPEMREAYGLLARVIEEMFGGYPPTASEELAERIAIGCI